MSDRHPSVICQSIIILYDRSTRKIPAVIQIEISNSDALDVPLSPCLCCQSLDVPLSPCLWCQSLDVPLSPCLWCQSRLLQLLEHDLRHLRLLAGSRASRAPGECEADWGGRLRTAPHCWWQPDPAESWGNWQWSCRRTDRSGFFLCGQ